VPGQPTLLNGRRTDSTNERPPYTDAPARRRPNGPALHSAEWFQSSSRHSALLILAIPRAAGWQGWRSSRRLTLMATSDSPKGRRLPDLCQHLEWSLLNAASSFSSFSGLAASLVLASMVIILVEYKGDENPTTAVAMFTVTLLALGMDTFIFGATSGEVLCARGGAQGLLAGSTLATGVSILLLGITLLQAKFKHSHAGLTLLGNLVTSMGALGTMALLALWAARLIDNLTILRLWPAPGISFVPSLLLISIFLATIIFVALARPGRRVREIAIVVTTCIYLLHIIASFVMYVATIVIPVDQWTVHTDPIVLILIIAISIAFPFIELTCVVMSLDWRGGRGRQEFWHRPVPAPGGTQPRSSIKEDDRCP
jgi:hypothetical protein